MANHALGIARSNLSRNPICWKLAEAQRLHSKRYKVALERKFIRDITPVDRFKYRYGATVVWYRTNPLRRA